MNALSQHITRCLLAGVVALLPIGGFVVTVVYVESTIASSWLAKQPFYFPGLGLIAATAGIYAIGLTVSTFVGRWFWSVLDRLLDGLPMLGRLYQTLKQIVGYSEGKDAMFHQVVLVPSGKSAGAELGLVTNEQSTAAGRQLVVFIPAAPNPTIGRLVIVDAAEVEPLAIPVSDAMKALLSVGKTAFSTAPSGSSGKPK
jgi:uncharacterized membrane protein